MLEQMRFLSVLHDVVCLFIGAAEHEASFIAQMTTTD